MRFSIVATHKSVSENRILRRILGAKRDKNEELHRLNRSSYIARVIKARKLRWTGHIARMEEVVVLSKF